MSGASDSPAGVAIGPNLIFRRTILCIPLFGPKNTRLYGFPKLAQHSLIPSQVDAVFILTAVFDNVALKAVGFLPRYFVFDTVQGTKVDVLHMTSE